MELEAQGPLAGCRRGLEEQRERGHLAERGGEDVGGADGAGAAGDVAVAAGAADAGEGEPAGWGQRRS